MEAQKKIGEEIKQLRIMNNLSIDDIATKSLLSHSFIAYLEGNNFSKLPSYVFSEGLFKNLLEVFSLSTVEEKRLILKFKQDFFSSNDEERVPEISDQTNKDPEEKNTTPPSFFNQNKFFISLSIILVVSIFILLALWNNLYSRNNQILERERKEKPVRTYSLYNKTDTFDLEVGDKVKVFSYLGTVDYKLLSISSSFNQDRFIIFKNSSTPAEIKLFLHLEYFYDLDKDGENDILIKFQKISGDVAVTSFTILKERDNEFDFEAIWNKEKKITLPLDKDMVLIENHFKTPINVFIQTGYLPVHLSFNVDGQKQNQVNLNPRSSFSLIAESHLTLQIGNYISTKLIINQIPLEWEDNNNSYSITKIIKWRPTIFNETKFNLLIKDYNN